MSNKKLPEFDLVTQAMESADVMAGAAEVHGVICGLICGGVELDGKSWLEPFNDLINEGFGLPSEAKRVAEEIYHTSCYQIGDANLSFALLLPDDNIPLDERAEAMSQWVQSFLVGFGMVQQELNKASEDLQELIKDFSDISQVSLDFEQEDEESEVAYAEVIEYLRVGAILSFNELGKKSAAETKPTLH